MNLSFESALIEQAKTGDRAALEALIKRHMDFVFRLSMTYLRQINEAEDATQEVFVKVWKHLRRFDTAKAFRPWLATIVRRTCLDILKKKRDLSFSAIDIADGETAFAEAIADEAAGPDVLTDRSLQADVVRDAVKTLSPVDQKILTLRFEEGLSFREIAERLHEPLNTMKSRCRRALLLLEERLQNSR